MPPLLEKVDDIASLPLTMLGATEGEELQGILGYRRVDDVVDIDRLAVYPARFRKGVGTSLLSSLHELEPDAQRFEVSTGAANAPAIALYRRAGYRETVREQRDGVEIINLVRAAPR